MKRSPSAVAAAALSRRRRLLVVLLSALAAIGFAAVPASAHDGTVWASGLTSTAPTVDGVLSPGEWASATSFPVTFQSLPGDPVAELSGTVYVMNDGTNLYVAAAINDASGGGLNSLGIFFDNTHDGVQTPGDDAWVINLGNFTSDDYSDGFGSYLQDPTNDLSGIGLTSGGVTTFEVAHPLCSGDTGHDICVTEGANVGLDFSYQSGDDQVFSFPGYFPIQDQYLDLVIASDASGAARQLSNLSATLDSFDLAKLGASLDGKLAAAQRFLAANKPHQACASLVDFVAQVNSQAGKGLTASQASYLGSSAIRIENVIGC